MNEKRADQVIRAQSVKRQFGRLVLPLPHTVMKEYDVSLQIITASASLADISALIGVEPEPDSHDVGSPFPNPRPERPAVWEQTIWKLRSEVAWREALDAHLWSIVEQVPLSLFPTLALLPDTQIILDIAVLYDTMTCSVSISAEWLGRLGEAGIDLEISCYPTDFSDGGTTA